MDKKKIRGFTLIEIMVVLVIIGIMAGLIAPKVSGRLDQARKITAKTDISTIINALRLYKIDNIRYPTKDQGLDSLIKKPTTAPIPNNYRNEGYLEKLPKDPWGNDYVYVNPGKHQEIDVYSVGPNGDSTTIEDSDGVIGSWQ
jgi:general secretion pathway protein G